MIVLTVRPLTYGWALQAAGLADTVFRSGAAAERAARSLAQRLADYGLPAKIVVRLKDGSVGGQFLFPPAPARAGREAWSEAA